MGQPCPQDLPLPEEAKWDLPTLEGCGSKYPNCVLEGIDDFTVGEGVELQWKPTLHQPFVWRFGILKALTCDENRHLATAVASFPDVSPHVMLASEPWVQDNIVFGDRCVRPMSSGG